MPLAFAPDWSCRNERVSRRLLAADGVEVHEGTPLAELERA